LQEKLLTDRFDQALVFASRTHRGQCRKGTNVPYISHLLAVCALVLENGGDEDQAVAALLHDAPEDQGGRGMLDRIRDELGTRVASLVAACSEPPELKQASWRERKEAFLRNLADAPPEALLVIAADKTHNLACLLDDHHHLGDAVFERFNGGKAGTLWYYGRLAEILAPRVPPPLAFRLTEAARALQALA
jgi:(p)ppGpp synthase/HD superfamily hydrolase